MRGLCAPWHRSVACSVRIRPAEAGGFAGRYVLECYPARDGLSDALASLPRSDSTSAPADAPSPKEEPPTCGVANAQDQKHAHKNLHVNPNDTLFGNDAHMGPTRARHDSQERMLLTTESSAPADHSFAVDAAKLADGDTNLSHRAHKKRNGHYHKHADGTQADGAECSGSSDRMHSRLTANELAAHADKKHSGMHEAPSREDDIPTPDEEGTTEATQAEGGEMNHTCAQRFSGRSEEEQSLGETRSPSRLKRLLKVEDISQFGQESEVVVPCVAGRSGHKQPDSLPLRQVHDQIRQQISSQAPRTTEQMPDLPTAAWWNESVTMLRARHAAEDRLQGQAHGIKENRSRMQSRAQSATAEHAREKSSWDFMLVEMQWLANDMAGERIWKQNAARSFADVCAKLDGRPQSRQEELEKNRRNVASKLSAQMSTFWRCMWALARASPSRERMRNKSGVVQWAVRSMQNTQQRENEHKSPLDDGLNAEPREWAWQVAESPEASTDALSSVSFSSEEESSTSLTFSVRVGDLERLRGKLSVEERERFRNYERKQAEWEQQERARQSAEQEAQRAAAKKEEEDRLRQLERFYLDMEIDRRRKAAAQQQRIPQGADSKATGKRKIGQRIAADDDEDVHVNEGGDRTKKSGKRQRRSRGVDTPWTHDEDAVSASEDEKQQHYQQVNKKGRKSQRAAEHPAVGPNTATTGVQQQYQQHQNHQQQKRPAGSVPQNTSYAQQLHARSQPRVPFNLWEDTVLESVIKDYGPNFTLAADTLNSSSSLRGIHRREKDCKAEHNMLRAAYERNQLESSRANLMNELNSANGRGNKKLGEALPVDSQMNSATRACLLDAFQKPGMSYAHSKQKAKRGPHGGTEKKQPTLSNRNAHYSWYSNLTWNATKHPSQFIDYGNASMWGGGQRQMYAGLRPDAKMMADQMYRACVPSAHSQGAGGNQKQSGHQQQRQYAMVTPMAQAQGAPVNMHGQVPAQGMPPQGVAGMSQRAPVAPGQPLHQKTTGMRAMPTTNSAPARGSGSAAQAAQLPPYTAVPSTQPLWAGQNVPQQSASMLPQWNSEHQHTPQVPQHHQQQPRAQVHRAPLEQTSQSQQSNQAQPHFQQEQHQQHPPHGVGTSRPQRTMRQR